MPKTATGKLDRRNLKRQYEALEQQVQASDNGAHATEERLEQNGHDWHSDAERDSFGTLRSLGSSILKVSEERISPSSRWTALGGDSLSAMMLVRDARLAGLRLTTIKVMSGETLLDLCKQIPKPDTTSSTNSKEVQSRRQGEDLLAVTDFQAEYLARGSGTERGLLYKFDMTMRAAVNTEDLFRALYLWIESTEALRLSFIQQPKKRPLQLVIPPAKTEWKRRVYSLSEADAMDEVSFKHDFVQHPLLVAVRTATRHQQDTV
ncbi:uncharacterized protein RCC_08380 [Ramularia collo-cygni]|uniref:Carrier domain-containing protein n=1 Tax=Ramularia collo-cygni TaxID=112498 RepID=A0A2D3VAL7_9PEZI|nr:uncharacterized protein RCC_08380 [Ramularia collo-cygni]CZT22675.1 uncharacterized protein RCC_08380 [Ramularia collo-cygni]